VVQGKVYAGTGADAVNGTIAAYGLQHAVCAADVSSQVTVTRGGWKFNRATNSYGETLTLTNTGGTVVGPVSVVYDDVTSDVAITSSSGATTCGNLTGSYYQTPTGTAMLAPGQSVPVYMVATTPISQTIQFNTRVLAGSGVR
jgi:predicted membrane-bound mannosyltransferase